MDAQPSVSGNSVASATGASDAPVAKETSSGATATAAAGQQQS